MYFSKSLMQQQFVLTHTIPETEIRLLMDNLLQMYLLSKWCVYINIASPYILV
jgi:hypothetical protein